LPQAGSIWFWARHYYLFPEPLKPFPVSEFRPFPEGRRLPGLVTAGSCLVRSDSPKDTVDPTHDIAERFERGVREFNSGDFYASHDTWEDVWMDVRGPERPFFQGMIQVAVGYYHLTCENYAGAEHLLTRGIRKLKAFGPTHRGLDSGDLVAGAATALAEVLEIRAGMRKAYRSEIAPRIRRV
jgi:predicted metal-dependent hydrolase